MEHKIPRKSAPSATERRVNEYEDGIAGAANPLLEKQGPRSHDDRCWTLVSDCVFIVPGVAFLAYAILIIANTGNPITERPLPLLVDAAAYGPTVFPIAFAAVTANFLKAYATWKLKGHGGISRLDLEYLLGSRTVVSALAAPFVLRSWSFLAPTLAVLWALSPLGGQASLRVIQAVPNAETLSHRFQWVEFMSQFPHLGPLTSAGIDTLPAVGGAFSAALTTPMNIKKASEDLFGNFKIPLVETYMASEVIPDPEGWYTVDNLDDNDNDGTGYTALLGLPMIAENGFEPEKSQMVNYSLQIDTSYIYANCVVSRGPDLDFGEWASLRNNSGPRPYTNDKTVLLWEEGPGFPSPYRDSPMELRFMSWTGLNTTTAACFLTMTHVQADIFCHQSTCEAVRVRPLVRADNVTIVTVLDGIDRSGDSITMAPADGFFQTFVGISQTYWEHLWPFDYYSTPIEYYFVNPASPFSPPNQNRWRGADIYLIGDLLFSYRMTQLLNTLWLANIARNLFGSDTFDFNVALADNPSLPQGFQPGEISLYGIDTGLIATGTGTATPDILIMRPDRAWLAVLILSSSLMLTAGVAGVVLGLLRNGGGILERATSLLDYDYSESVLLRRKVEVLQVSASWRKQQVRLDPGEGITSTIPMDSRR